jgi:hypothetical protein
METGWSVNSAYNIQAYRISSRGTLQSLGNIGEGCPGLQQTGPSQLYFTGNNKYAFQPQCLSPPPLEIVICDHA